MQIKVSVKNGKFNSYLSLLVSNRLITWCQNAFLDLSRKDLHILIEQLVMHTFKVGWRQARKHGDG